MMLGCRSERWLMISLNTFSSIFWPRGMYFMATSSLVSLFRISRATPKLPAPMSLSSSYFSMGAEVGAGGQRQLSDRSERGNLWGGFGSFAGARRGGGQEGGRGKTRRGGRIRSLRRRPLARTAPRWDELDSILLE
uniref:SAPK7 n=1 Tax=Arundo donax TaxID=35708 RepID=A0A0A9DQW4_ARUDO